jgi:hypothetical protein
MHGYCNGNACAAVEEYQRCFPAQSIPSKSVFSHVHQTECETGCHPSVSVQCEMEVVPDINPLNSELHPNYKFQLSELFCVVLNFVHAFRKT